MKKYTIKFITLVVAIIAVLCSSCTSIGGYCFDIDDARSEHENCYEDADYIFTCEDSGQVVDFVIQGDRFHCIGIDCRSFGTKTTYCARARITTLLQDNIDKGIRNGEYFWTNTDKISAFDYSWCIVPEEFNEANDNLPSFNFVYNGVSYSLCYEIRKQRFHL